MLGKDAERELAGRPNVATLKAWRLLQEQAPPPVMLRCHAAMRVARKIAATYGMERAREWMAAPHSGCGGATPLQYLATLDSAEEMLSLDRLAGNLQLNEPAWWDTRERAAFERSYRGERRPDDD